MKPIKDGLQSAAYQVLVGVSLFATEPDAPRTLLLRLEEDDDGDGTETVRSANRQDLETHSRANSFFPISQGFGPEHCQITVDGGNGRRTNSLQATVHCVRVNTGTNKAVSTDLTLFMQIKNCPPPGTDASRSALTSHKYTPRTIYNLLTAPIAKSWGAVPQGNRTIFIIPSLLKSRAPDQDLALRPVKTRVGRTSNLAGQYQFDSHQRRSLA